MHEVFAKAILSAKNGMNIYRGCSHGCIYCDSRSTCYGMDHAFEDIEVKINAPQLLEQALRSKRNQCMIGTGAMCDPYMPIEKELGLTRKCLEIIEHYGFGVSLLTKSDLILRDLDLIKKINEKTKCVVQITLTTYDEDLCKILEPNVCTTKRRAEVLNILRDEGIPTVVWLCPILPFINDSKENLMGVLEYTKNAEVKGIMSFGIGMTLRDGDRQYFYSKLDKHFPGMKEKYIKAFGNQYHIPCPDEKELMKLFYGFCNENQIMCSTRQVFAYTAAFEEKGSGEQMNLFDFMEI